MSVAQPSPQSEPDAAVPAAPEAPCADCGTVLTGPYCAQCGAKRFTRDEQRFTPYVKQLLQERLLTVFLSIATGMTSVFIQWHPG